LTLKIDFFLTRGLFTHSESDDVLIIHVSELHYGCTYILPVFICRAAWSHVGTASSHVGDCS